MSNYAALTNSLVFLLLLLTIYILGFDMQNLVRNNNLILTDFQEFK